MASIAIGSVVPRTVGAGRQLRFVTVTKPAGKRDQHPPLVAELLPGARPPVRIAHPDRPASGRSERRVITFSGGSGTVPVGEGVRLRRR